MSGFSFRSFRLPRVFGPCPFSVLNTSGFPHRCGADPKAGRGVCDHHDDQLTGRPPTDYMPSPLEPAPTGADWPSSVMASKTSFVSPSSPSVFAVTTMRLRPLYSPRRMSSVSGSSTKFSIARRSGRAPKSGRSLLDQELLGRLVELELQAVLGQPLADLAQLQLDDVESGRRGSGGGRRSSSSTRLRNSGRKTARSPSAAASSCSRS